MNDRRVDGTRITFCSEPDWSGSTSEAPPLSTFAARAQRGPTVTKVAGVLCAVPTIRARVQRGVRPSLLDPRIVTAALQLMKFELRQITLQTTHDDTAATGIEGSVHH
jgi:hypothetical protein